MSKKIGLCLGSGGARGLAHIGVIKYLLSIGIEPSFIVGTSAGAIVGAALACGKFEELEHLVLSSDWKFLTKMFTEFKFRISGFFTGNNIVKFLDTFLECEKIEETKIPFACVATNINTGKEVVFREGKLTQAIRASFSIPGIFTPVKIGDMRYVDGALTNPVPVTVARAMGMDSVIAVDINLTSGTASTAVSTKGVLSKILDKVEFIDIISRTLRISENRLTQNFLNASPPDILISPPVGNLLPGDFSHVEECIEAGFNAAKAQEEVLDALCL